MKRFFALIVLLAGLMSLAACEKHKEDEFEAFVNENYCSISLYDNTAYFISLAADGSVNGQSFDKRVEETAAEYEGGTIYGNVFSFNLSDLKKRDDYSYTASMGEITYVYDPNTEEIENVTKEDGSGMKIRDVFTAPLSASQNGQLIFFIPTTPFNMLPKEVADYLKALSFSPTSDDSPIDTDILYFEGDGKVFITLPQQ